MRGKGGWVQGGEWGAEGRRFRGLVRALFMQGERGRHEHRKHDVFLVVTHRRKVKSEQRRLRIGKVPSGKL